MAVDMDSVSVHNDELDKMLLALQLDIEEGRRILGEIHSNENDFAVNCNKKREMQALFGGQLQGDSANYVQLLYECGIPMGGILTEPVDVLMQENLKKFLHLVPLFEQIILKNIRSVVAVQDKLISEKLSHWKYEQQKIAARMLVKHSTTLDKLELWCGQLAQHLYECYEQLQEAERILKGGTLYTGNAASLVFVNNCREEVVRLLGELLNNSLIVDQQPPQIVKMKIKFPKPVMVRLLGGKSLNIHVNPPQLSAYIISEEQVRALPMTNGIETGGEITNSRTTMDKNKNDSHRITFIFRNMQVKAIKRTERRLPTGGIERVMEEKSCLYFEGTVPVGLLKFKVSTISLPVVVTSHVSQEAMAAATIAWDNAFATKGRVPFVVPDEARWAEVAQILSTIFYKISNKGLTQDNLDCLARKIFRNQYPPPAIVTWSELCKENLPGMNFTFWTWFHSAVKLIEKRENNLKDLWKEGLIEGFIEREMAEICVGYNNVGTFLLRFPDSVLGSIHIVFSMEQGKAIYLNPFVPLHLQAKKLALFIQESEGLQFLYQATGTISKNDAFRQFYETQSSVVPRGYWPLSILTLHYGKSEKAFGIGYPYPTEPAGGQLVTHNQNSYLALLGSGSSPATLSESADRSSTGTSPRSSNGSPVYFSNPLTTPGNDETSNPQNLDTSKDTNRAEPLQFFKELNALLKNLQRDQDLEMTD